MIKFLTTIFWSMIFSVWGWASIAWLICEDSFVGAIDAYCFVTLAVALLIAFNVLLAERIYPLFLTLTE